MYIDKLYNRLYSDKTALKTFLKEVKLFSEEGGVIDQYTKNMQRSIANKLTNVTKIVGKLLSIGIPVAGITAYLNRSEGGREWLKNNTGFDWDQTKENISDKWDQITGNSIANSIPENLNIVSPIGVSEGKSESEDTDQSDSVKSDAVEEAEDKVES